MDNLLRFKKSLQNFAHPFCSNINSSYIYKALEHLPYPFIACNDGGLWHNIFIYPATNNVGTLIAMRQLIDCFNLQLLYVRPCVEVLRDESMAIINSWGLRSNAIRAQE